MTTFERAFNDAEQAAASTIKSAAALTSLAKQMEKAAKTGNIAHIKRAQTSLNEALSSLGQEVSNAVHVWPFRDDEEEQRLRDDYAAELTGVAASKGLKIYEQDSRLISHPSIVRIMPGERAVRVDKKKVPTIRPSHLTKLLIENQEKPGRYRSNAFLESLYSVYSDIVTRDSDNRLIRGGERVVPLKRIYELLTALPGARRDYSAMDFARDLYVLDDNGPRCTRKGAVVSFSASTATRGSSGRFSFVGPDGQSVDYYGIKFTAGG